MFLDERDFDNADKLQVIKGFLDQYPCLYGIKDVNSRFIVANETMATLTGYRCANEIMELRVRTEEFRCKTADMAEQLYAEDADIISQKKQAIFLGCTNFAVGDKQVLYGTKTPILDANNEVIAIIDHFMDITHSPLFNLSPILSSHGFFDSAGQSKEQFSYLITNSIEKYNITDRQFDCIYYLLRGKPASKIGQLLNLSRRTIETHIDMLKRKLNCCSKSELIEKALDAGMLNYIPRKILFNT